MEKWIQWNRDAAPPVMVGDTVLTGEAWALRLCWPRGGFVWNRPAAVLVEREGQRIRLPIVDVTRRVQLLLLLLSALFLAIGLRYSARQGENNGQ